MKPGIIEERRMLQKCFSGDEKTLEYFVRVFSPLIYNTVRSAFAVKSVRFNNQDIEDLHNTVFLKLFESDCRKLKQYKGLNGCRLSTWLRVVTLRMALNDMREKGSKISEYSPKRRNIDDVATLKSDAPGILELMIKGEDRDRMQQGIRALSARERMFIRLHIENGLSLKDVAETMALSMANAYTIKHRAVSHLKEFVASLENAGSG